jgi:hypothetical protein
MEETPIFPSISKQHDEEEVIQEICAEEVIDDDNQLAPETLPIPPNFIVSFGEWGQYLPKEYARRDRQQSNNQPPNVFQTVAGRLN